MCLNCGCGSPGDDHGDRNNITLSHLHSAATVQHISAKEAANNIVKSLRNEGYIDDDGSDAGVGSTGTAAAVPNVPGVTGEEIRAYTSADDTLLGTYSGKAHPGNVGEGVTSMAAKEPILLSAFREAALKFAEKHSKTE